MVDASSAAVILKDLEEFDVVEEFQLGDHGQQSMSPELFRLVFDLVHKGNRAFREGRFKEAINFYSKARLSEECETIVLSNRSAAFCSYSKQLRSRSASLSEYQAIDGLDPTTYAELALKDAEKVMNVQPNSTKVYYLRAKALILLEQYDAARETLVVGLQIDPFSIPLQRSIQNLDKITAGSERRIRCSKLQRTDDFDCTLCFKLLYDPVTTPCGHSFCRPCLLQSMDHGNKCPMCRTVLFISAKAYPVSVTLKNIIQKNFADEYILDVARTIMIHSHVPHSYWGDAVLTACYVINRMPSSVLGDLIPISVLFPDRELFSVTPRIFGCVAFVQVLSPGKDKLSPRAIKTIFVGYSRTQKGYRCYDPSTRRYYVSADVTFFESTSYFSPNGTQLRVLESSDEVHLPLPLIQYSTPIDPRFGAVYQRRTKPVEHPHCEPVHSPSTPKVIPEHTDSADNSLSDDNTGEYQENASDPDTNELDLPIAQQKGKRACTLHPISDHLSMDRLTPTYRQFVKGLSAIALPLTFTEALSDPKWAAAMKEEMDALQSRGTWTLVTPSSDAAIVRCKWVFTVKYKADGGIERYKERLVAKGYTQTYGVVYYDTFSPVARHASLRILLAVAVSKNWSLSQFDVKNAFLYGDLHEEVHMQQPPGFVAEGECQKVCRLSKAIYGLKQSPRAWFQKLSEKIEQEGFVRSSADHSLFVKKTSTGTVIDLVYVDDIIVTGDDDQGISNLKNVLGHHFITKDLGELRYFLGIEFARNQRGLIMCQRKYVTDVLQETGMLGCRPASTPMDIHAHLYDDDTEDVDARQYRGVVGKLLYITVTRPDIAYAVSRVSQFMDKPKKAHWDAVMMILRYLKNSPGRGLLFQNGTSLTISVYADADYAGSPLDRKSTNGFCVYIGSNLVTWKSKKQTVVARSSAESEYRAMARATAEAMWVRSLMLDLTVEVSLPMQLLCDNKAALFIANNPAFHERTKHVEVDCHYTRDMIQKGFVIASHISTTGQTADIFTKALSRGPFQSCCSKLSMFDIYAPT